MGDRIRAYQNAMNRLDTAALRVKDFVDEIKQAAKHLEKWEETAVAHVTAKLPMELLLKNRIIDGQKWPTAQQLADTLADWHRARQEARLAWDMIPVQDRTSLRPPP
ncbi:MAG TPA: hypothetical protein VG013_15950 [Gemmataceae bacterium]|jgi:hypothetical protein|nr:hypothetical protein [Gemmataceae bacterium]